MGFVTRRGNMRNAYKLLIGKPEGKKPLRRSKRRYKKRLGGYGLDYSGLSSEHGNKPLGSTTGGKLLDCLSVLSAFGHNLKYLYRRHVFVAL